MTKKVRLILFRLILIPAFLAGLISPPGSVIASPSAASPSAASPNAAAPAPQAPATCGTGDPGVVAGTCTVTILGLDFPTGAALPTYNFLVNVDNTKLTSDPNALSTESNSPIVRKGDQTRSSFTLPDGRYLVSMRSTDHKMWGAYFTLPTDAANNGTLTVSISLTVQSADHPLPLGKINVFVFNDNAWTNGAPDTEEGGLGGFQVGLKEQTDSPVTVDYNNNPLCGGVCTTSAAAADEGFVSIPNLGPATYFIDVHPPDGVDCNPSIPGSRWFQTTTIDGGLSLIAPTEEGADGTGAPGEQLWEPPTIRTAYWFGFVCAPHPFAAPGTGEITGTARNWVEWAPYTTGTYNDPVETPLVALSDNGTDQTVYVGRGDANGNFDIQGVPAGDYNLAVWDEQLSYIMRFKPVHVDAGATVDVNDLDDAGNPGLGVSRWFGWLDGYVYKDTNGNGKMDPGEPTIANTDMDQRWRDGSIKESTFTDPSGYYQYPTAEGGALGRWIINEQGFARFSSFPGASYHDEHTGAVLPSCAGANGTPANPCLPNAEGGGLLVNQLLLEGHRATVDWGKHDYGPNEPGQIVGITYFATTRNEFDAARQAHEDYEPAIPDVTVYLETPGPDLIPNTADDVIVNKYITDHWVQPSAAEDPLDPANSFRQNCSPIRDFTGADITSQFNPNIGPNCLEVPLTGQQIKEGKFDGGYAFASYCPGGYDMAADNGTCNGGGDPVPLVAGNYITHVIMPQDPTNSADCNTGLPPGDLNVTSAKGAVPGGGVGCIYRIVKEEDVNVDLGNNFAPQIPPPPCVGDEHIIDQTTLTPRSWYYGVAGAQAPLCDKHLVVLGNGQNANADFHMMTNFPTDPNGADANDTHTGDVEEPGRIVGQVFNDIYFERDMMSPWYGEPRPIANIPIGVYARVDTVCAGGGTACATPNVNTPFDPNKWRLIKTISTSPDGAYEILLPSTESLNCPIPQGPCPGMYLVMVDDPGSKAHPNANYNPNMLTATTPAEVWPGLTDQLDTPIDPISGTACELPAGETGLAVPELLQVSSPVIAAGSSGAGRQITIYGDFIGATGTATNATGVRVTLTDDRSGQVQTLTRANGGIVSWTPGTASTPDTIVIAVPALASDAVANALPATAFRPGPKQLNLITAAINGGITSANGLTLHVLGANGTGANAVAYNPPVVNVPAPTTSPADAHLLQNAIDGAAAGSLLVLGAGTYNENLLLWKPLKIQGLGPGGIVGAHELAARDPEDPRFNIKGTIVDGRFYQQNFTSFDTTVSAHAPYVLPSFTSGAPSVVLRGADITVVAQSTTAFDVPATLTGFFSSARVDGLGLMTGHGDGAGGLQLMASINNLQITNNVLENNGGVFAGGIGLGQPFVHGSHNYNVRMENNRLIGNGGLTTSGGVGIFYGSNNYDFGQNVVCSNFSVEYGAGISHIGLSPNGNIHENKIYYNEAVDSGGGIAVEGELVVGGASLSDGSGAVNIDRNLIQSNISTLDDGGGVFVLDALNQIINIRNNMIVDNVAADLGGAVMLDDASNVRFINNTIADNDTTGSSENSTLDRPRGAGLTSEANDPLFQATLPPTAAHFSDPVALFNNIFWNNDAFTLSAFGPGATLVDHGFIDFEVHDPTNPSAIFSNARYNLFTNGNVEQANGSFANMPGGGAPLLGFPTVVANRGNIVGIDPLFVTPFINELAVSGSRLDPQQAAVSITGQDPPVGLVGDYHLQNTLASGLTSSAVDRGVNCSNTLVPPPTNPLTACGFGVAAPLIDMGGNTRPQPRSFRFRTPWDLGADELPLIGTNFDPAVTTPSVLFIPVITH